MLPDAEQTDLAQRYFVGDIPGARIAGSRLRGILERLATGQRPSALQLDFLKASSLFALAGWASGDLDQAVFEAESRTEAVQRLAARTRAEEAAAAERERLATTSAAYFNEPVVKRRNAEREMRHRYGTGYLEPDIYRRMMRILRAFDGGTRIAPDDALWLTDEGLWTHDLFRSHHRREAVTLTALWRQTRDPWQAVTASGHWRKAEEPDMALSVTGEVEAKGLPSKLGSALLTTRGGALRDLGRFSEALEMGFAAHALMPHDHRPCTLLGAVHIQTGHYVEGADWYDKAEARGASRRSVDADLRSILAGASPEERRRLAAFLLQKDAARYGRLARDAGGTGSKSPPVSDARGPNSQFRHLEQKGKPA